MKVLVKVYDKPKYEKESKKAAEFLLTDIASILVRGISDEEIYSEGFDMIDEYKEYCILTNVYGDKSTFRNSYVDIFKQ